MLICKCYLHAIYGRGATHIWPITLVANEYIKGRKNPRGFIQDPDHIFCVRVYVNSDSFVECELLHKTKP